MAFVRTGSPKHRELCPLFTSWSNFWVVTSHSMSAQ
jgi:hypothetical protein